MWGNTLGPQRLLAHQSAVCPSPALACSHFAPDDVDRHLARPAAVGQYWWAICAAGPSSSAFCQRSTRWPRRHAPATVLSCRDRKMRTTWDGGRGCRLPTGDGSRAVHGGRTARAAWDCVLPRRVPPHLGPRVEHHTAARARGAATRCRRIRCEVGITP